MWRPASSHGVEVVLVHRPRYDDWSLPKGKIEPWEHPVRAAVREVGEETGQRVALGRPLPTQCYEVAQGTKSVQYWAGRSLGGSFLSSTEVDEIVWLDPVAAAARLTHGSDHVVLAAFAAAPADTHALLVLRHVQALPRKDWKGTDGRRPVSAGGRRQAAALAGLLGAFGPRRILSSPATRCLETVAPFAAAAGFQVELVPGLAQDAPAGAPARARHAVHRLHREDVPAVVCTHRPVLPALLRELSGDGEPIAAGEPMRPSEFLVLHRRGGTVVAVERHGP